MGEDAAAAANTSNDVGVRGCCNDFFESSELWRLTGAVGGCNEHAPTIREAQPTSFRPKANRVTEVVIFLPTTRSASICGLTRPDLEAADAGWLKKSSESCRETGGIEAKSGLELGLELAPPTPEAPTETLDDAEAAVDRAFTGGVGNAREVAITAALPGNRKCDQRIHSAFKGYHA